MAISQQPCSFTERRDVRLLLVWCLGYASVPTSPKRRHTTAVGQRLPTQLLRRRRSGGTAAPLYGECPLIGPASLY
jgi:hypothetical protein